MIIPDQNVPIKPHNCVLCTAGHEYFGISHEGLISRCMARIGDLCGHIEEPASFHPVATLQCDGKICPTDDEILWTTVISGNGSVIKGHESTWNVSDHKASRWVFSIFYAMRCNMRCWYCSSASPHCDAAKDAATDIPAAKWLDFFRFVKTRYQISIEALILGGEPSMRADFPDLVRGFAQMGIKSRIYTNLSIPSRFDELFSISKEYPAMTRWAVTIHPHDPQVAWTDVVERIALLVAAGCCVEANAIDVLPKVELKSVDAYLRAKTGLSLTIVEDIGGRGWKAPADRASWNKQPWATHHVKPRVDELKIDDIEKSRASFPFMVGLQQLGCCDMDIREKSGVICSMIQRGVRWFDLAHVYGNSAEAISAALKSVPVPTGFVSKVLTRGYDDTMNQWREHRVRLDGARPSALILHGICEQGEVDLALGDHGGMDALRDLVESGDIMAAGISTSNFQFIDRLIEDPRVELIMFPISIFTAQFHDIRAILSKAHARGKVVIGMQTLVSGRIKPWKKHAVAYAVSLDSMMPLIGFNSMWQIDDLASLFKSKPAQASSSDIEAMMAYIGRDYCTWCRSCSCPHGINIGQVLQLKNHVHVLSGPEHVPYQHQLAMDASMCISCGSCSCPYGIDIPAKLKEYSRIFRASKTMPDT